MKTKLLSPVALLLSLALIFTAMPGLVFAEEKEDAFTLWTEEAPALNALIDYVEAVTDPNSPDYIPGPDRIATFDMDGTLMGELFPTYLEVILLTERILVDPSYQPDREMLEFGRMTRDHALDKSFPGDYDYEFSYHQAKAFAGMTLPEYADFITRCLVHEADGFEGMTYAGAYYQPMEEVVNYLRDNGFKCYVVSGSDRFIVRTFIEGAFDIPAENIIGSDTALAARNQGDSDGIEYVFTGDDELVRTDRLLIKDLKTNKVVQIAQEIGRQPVLSFGNSSGDVSMNNYALLNNRYRSAAFMLVADDDVRDYGNPARHDELTQKWQDMGYNVISMRDDWKTIYGEDVVKTGEFHWLERLAENRIPADGRVSYLGPAGTYTEEAAQFFFQDGETLTPKETVNDAIADLLSDEADYAVIPQENTVGGAVVNYVDALIGATDTFVVGEVVLPISQTLMGVPGAKLEEITAICSHAQGLTQSAQWRARHLPEARTEEMASTAAAAKYVADTGDPSIAAVAAPGAAALYGLEVLAENVQITDANKTRFYVLSKQRLEGEGLHRTVFVATCEANQIDDIILRLHEAGLEIVTLHDRPEGSSLGTYHYVIEAESGTGVTEAQINSVCAMDGVRFAGCFNAVEKK